MYTQIFLGIYWLFVALTDWLQKPILMSRKARARANKGYFGLLALTHTLIGVLFIMMGIIEKHARLSTGRFLLLYIGLAFIPLGLAIYNNKKHFGQVFIRNK